MDKMKMESPDMTAQNIDRIAALFPNCITETVDENGKLKRAINFELLKQVLSPDVVDGDERYEFTYWFDDRQKVQRWENLLIGVFND